MILDQQQSWIIDWMLFFLELIGYVWMSNPWMYGRHWLEPPSPGREYDPHHAHRRRSISGVLTPSSSCDNLPPRPP